MNEPSKNPAPQRGKAFRTTQWSLVDAASADSKDALEELCQTYWPPLHFYLRRLGFGEPEAEDLIQAFFVRLLEHRLIAAADVHRGRFRTFLLTALRRFVINEWKQENALKRGGGVSRVLMNINDVGALADAEVGKDVTPERQFERQWATLIIQQAFLVLAAEYTAAGQQSTFDTLLPFIAGEASQSYDELAAELQSTAGALRMAVSRMRARWREQIRAEIRKTVHTDSEVDDEIRSLFQALQS